MSINAFRENKELSSAAFLGFALLFPVLAFGQVAPEVTLNVELQDFVWYIDKSGDATKYATVPGITPAPAEIGGAFRRYLIVADLVSVGGKPATGTFFAHGIAISTSNEPQPVPGRPIADFPRNQMHDFVLEVMTPDRAQVGSLVGFLLGSGAAPPGAPPGAGFWAVVGGTGAYVGVRGQGANMGSTNTRTTSMIEDPAFRRVNGGGQMRLSFNLSGASLAEVMAAYHATDSTAVTTSRPARPGELLVLQVKAGWPAKPYLQEGKVFSGEPFQDIAVPVEAVVNGTPAEIVVKFGWPGTRDRYRVDVRLPSGVAPGMATLQLNGAYLPGVPFNIPVQ